jgi:hypothetical protein
MWTDHGCRGLFTCDGIANVQCGHEPNPQRLRQVCRCVSHHGPTPSPPPPPSPPSPVAPQVSVWSRNMSDGDIVAVVLNKGPATVNVTVPLSLFGSVWTHQSPTRAISARDLWKHQDLQLTGKSYSVVVKSHAAVVYRLSHQASRTDYAINALPPSIYWTSTPTLANETLLISGAGLEDSKISLCHGSSTEVCTELHPTDVTVWNHSIKFTLPAGCGVPCRVSISKTAAVGAAQTTTTTSIVNVSVNSPDVWWAKAVGGAGKSYPESTGSSLGPIINPVLCPGGTLRLFGRALAWSDNNQRCISSADPPGPVSTTKLTLTSENGKLIATVPAVSASCYESTFRIPEHVMSSVLEATVSTAWGTSLPFAITVSPPPAPAPPPTVIKVIEDCRGDLYEAMRKAAASKGGTVVELGARAYALRRPLVIPNHTKMVGEGVVETSISFELLPPVSKFDPLLAAVSVGSVVELANFSVSLTVNVAAVGLHNKSQYPGTVGVLMPHDASNFIAADLQIMTNGNASNALRIEGDSFSVTGCLLWQRGCTLASGFQPSTTLLLSNARDGHFASNTISWMCSAFDLDTSERVIFEMNHITLNTTGTIPHGNSVSAYGGPPGQPLNRWWAFLRNRFQRPPCNQDAAAPSGQCGGTNWMQRETLTTDNSHAEAVGFVVSQRSADGEGGATHKQMSGPTVTMKWVSWSMEPKKGTTLVVVNGSGMGQSRMILDIIDNETLVIESLFDGFLRSDSFCVVVNSYRDKLLAGNRFEWTEVVQYFGVNLNSAIVDNTLIDANVNHTLHTTDPVIRKFGGSMRAVRHMQHTLFPLN